MSRGLVRIEKDARRTLELPLSEHAMLLTRGARSDTIPILEILCRDVKATHSTSVAPVDPEKVFYLESRGVPEDGRGPDDRGGVPLPRPRARAVREPPRPPLPVPRRPMGRPTDRLEPAGASGLPPLEFRAATPPPPTGGSTRSCGRPSECR